MQPLESPIQQPINLESKDVEEKELKNFFEVSENIEELQHRMQKMFTPPQDSGELKELQRQLGEAAKKRCKQCGKRLSPTEQSMHCRCQKYFCKNHREPRQHYCSIDYKQFSRAKLIKENPKVRGP